jgi:hypothetical protein
MADPEQQQRIDQFIASVACWSTAAGVCGGEEARLFLDGAGVDDITQVNLATFVKKIDTLEVHRAATEQSQHAVLMFA